MPDVIHTCINAYRNASHAYVYNRNGVLVLLVVFVSLLYLQCNLFEILTAG